LKFSCVLDDHYEVYMNHNIEVLEKLGSKSKYFSFLNWLRWSKLRLDHLMSANYDIRRQFKEMATIGTPDILTSALVADREKFDVTTQDPPSSKLEPLASLLEDLSIGDEKKFVSYDPGLTLSPLKDTTELLLKSEEIDKNVKLNLRKLEALKDSDTTLLRNISGSDLTSFVIDTTGRETQEFTLESVKPPKNWLYSDSANKSFPSSVKQSEYVMQHSGAQYFEDISRGACDWSVFNQPNPSRDSNIIYDVRKQYWFSSIPRDMKRNLRRIGRLESQLLNNYLATLPRNYGWVLRYLATSCSLSPLQLHLEVRRLEQVLSTLDPEYFGQPKLLEQVCSSSYTVRESSKKYIQRVRDLKGFKTHCHRKVKKRK